MENRIISSVAFLIFLNRECSCQPYFAFILWLQQILRLPAFIKQNNRQIEVRHLLHHSQFKTLWPRERLGDSHNLFAGSFRCVLNKTSLSTYVTTTKIESGMNCYGIPEKYNWSTCGLEVTFSTIIIY